MICNDSNYPELARRMAVQGASALFIPTNNSLPNERASLKVNAAARSRDVALATENRLWVIRADMAGRNGNLTCFGCSQIIDPQGNVVQRACVGQEDLLVANIPLKKVGVIVTAPPSQSSLFQLSTSGTKSAFHRNPSVCRAEFPISLSGSGLAED
ncbi:MAG: carbon-nitrogen hydrolase family protein [Acidobacteriaceae bacterium]|nr:carbon-nitrogen hydrolase family protein [Acidobacteriaceae bacterium]